MAMPWWWKDRSLKWALLACFLLRVVPMVVWATKTCTHDECTYERMAKALLAGQGMTSTLGWLWAPAYPFLMAVMSRITGYPGSIQVLQLPGALLTQLLVALLARQVNQDGSEDGMKAARWAAWIYALNPTYIFYTCSDWSESLYGLVLMGAVVMLGRARGDLDLPLWKGSWRQPWMAGVLVGICVLFRGVATYILPIFLLGLAWGRWRGAWRGVLALGLATVLTVAPYSVYASVKFGGLIISDRTLGQMMWLGNNTFPPATFDWGIGTLGKGAYSALEKSGRPPCPQKNAVLKDNCEVQQGMAWIQENPGEFLKRVPLRVSQLLNPHSFLTRHLRWGKWAGLPKWFDELLILAIPLFTILTLMTGTLGWFARANRSSRQSWYPVVAGLIVLYHVAAIAVLAGLSRYRVPLEPLWLVLGAGVLAEPKMLLDRIAASRWRLGLCLGTCGVLFLLILRYLPSGWSWWGSW